MSAGEVMDLLGGIAIGQCLGDDQPSDGRRDEIVRTRGPTTFLTTSLPIDKILSLHVVGADDDQRYRFE